MAGGAKEKKKHKKVHFWECIRTTCRVSFRKMGKGGQNNTYKINGGAKGVHAIVHLLGGHLQDYLF